MKLTKSWVVGGLVPVVLTLLAVYRILTFDAAISVVETILALSPIPVIIANYRMKMGQPKLAMVTLTSGLLSIGSMFLLSGFVLTSLATIFSGVLWGIVAVQAFLYFKPAAPKQSEAICIEEDPTLCHPDRVYEAVDEGAGRALQKGTLLVEVFDANSPEIEAKATALIKAALESMR